MIDNHHNFIQDLFFLNIPSPSKTIKHKLKFLRILREKSPIFSKIQNPCFIYTGNGRIEKLEKLIFEPKIRKKIRKQTLYIFLYEPICIEIYGKLNFGFYSEFKNDLCEYKNVNVQELESIRIFMQNNNLHDVKIFTTECNIEKLRFFYPDLQISCFDVFIHHLCVVGRSESRLPNTISKKFWCGNWRYTLHRHLVMSYLIRYEGNYSWNYHVNFRVIKKNYWFDFKKFREENPNQYEIVREGIEDLNNNSFELVASEFCDKKIKVPFLAATCYPAKHNSTKSFGPLIDTYKNCFCAIVNETRFAQPFGGVSEKTLDVIVARLPFVLVAPPHSLAYLKSFGVKTFDRWWDESYDAEEDHTLRLIKIFNIIDQIGNKSFSELSTIYDEMLDTIEHNRTIILNFPLHQPLT